LQLIGFTDDTFDGVSADLSEGVTALFSARFLILLQLEDTAARALVCLHCSLARLPETREDLTGSDRDGLPQLGLGGRRVV